MCHESNLSGTKAQQDMVVAQAVEHLKQTISDMVVCNLTDINLGTLDRLFWWHCLADTNSI